MPFVSPALLERSIEALKPHHALLLISIPKMLEDGRRTVATQADADAAHNRFGAPEEKQFLDAHFRLPGGPPGKAWYSPSTGWIDDRYPGRSLQRQKDDYSRKGIFFKTTSGPGVGYVFRSGFADAVAAQLLPERRRVSLLALAAWLYRAEDVADLDALIAHAKALLGLDRDDLLTNVFDDAVTAEDKVDGLAAQPVSDAELAEIISAVPPPADLATDLDGFVKSIEDKMTARHVILPERLVSRVVRAWVCGEIAVLVGSPGTGKTTIAKEFAAAVRDDLHDDAVLVAVEPDIDVAAVLGYENLAGEFVERPFASDVLRSDAPLHPHVVRLEEWNTAPVETYLSPVLHAIESGDAIPLGRGAPAQMPVDTLFIATCNSVRDEPETRLPVSRPTKQRAVVIEMPNVLLEAYKAKDREGIVETANRLLDRKRREVADRISGGRKTAFDALRRARLDATKTLDDLDEATRDVLLDLSVCLLEDLAEGQRIFTARVLGDMLLDLVIAGPDSATALGDLVTGKVLQQITTMPLAQKIAEVSAPLPVAAEIASAVAAMEGPGGTARPLI